MTLHDQIEAITGQRPTDVRSLHGGMVGEVYKISMPDGVPLVAKVDPTRKALLRREGYMLRYMRPYLPVPDVLHSDDSLLLMTFIDGQSRFDARAEQHAADLLAALHGVTAPRFGLQRDTLIGPIPQPNPQTPRWVDFFREHRLLYMADVMVGRGRLPATVRKKIDKLAAKLPGLIDEPAAPALVHGDVWSTNVLAKDGRVTGFIDPACYYGHPEMDLAYITLFGTFGNPFFARYNAHRPIEPGFFEVRRDIYNLYPLLVHVRLFGGGYVNSVYRILDRLID